MENNHHIIVFYEYGNWSIETRRNKIFLLQQNAKTWYYNQ